PPGQVAVTLDSRKKDNPVVILSQGVHVLDDPQWRFQMSKPVQEKRIDLGQQTSGKRFCEVYTSDRVKFHVTAFLLFKVTNPKTAFVDVQDIEDVLRREAES